MNRVLPRLLRSARRVPALTAVGGALVLVVGALAAPAAPMPGRATLVSADDNGLVVDLALPSALVAAIEDPTRPCPEGLDHGALLGLPAPGAGQVTVLDTDERRRPAGHLCRGAAARAAAAGVHLSDVGWLRHQSVARLALHGLGAAPGARPEDELIVRTRARVRVRYGPMAGPLAQPGPADDPFARIAANSLLNGGSLPMPLPVADRPSGPPAQHAEPEQSESLAVKLGVALDGAYGVTGSALAAAGWELDALDPASLALSVGGMARPLRLVGTEDGRLDSGDRVEFYGQAMTGPYTRENVYWLRQDGEPSRMAVRAAAPEAAPPAATSFPETRHYERDSVYFLTMSPHDGDDRWMWGTQLTAVEQRDFPIDIDNLAAEPAPGRLLLRLQGYTNDVLLSPDHHTRVRLNGRLLGDWHWDGRGVEEHELDVPAGLLVLGANTVSVESVGDTGASVDAFFVNSLDVRYAAGFQAVGDRLAFGAPGEAASRTTFELSGFTHPVITVLDVTDPTQPVTLTDLEVTGGPDVFGARLTDTHGPAARYLAYSRPGLRSPANVRADQPSALRATEQQADYLVIVHPSLVDTVAPLVARRRADGLAVQTVLVDDIYDEFADGVFDPRAIRAFLQHAYGQWSRPAPTYVLLVGNANLDYRDGYDTGWPNLVPSMQIDLDEGGVATSDLWFAALSGDDFLPDVLLGRISASRPSEATVAISKTLGYRADPIGQEWQRRVILVADDDDPAEMPAFSELIARVLSPAETIERFYAGEYPRGRDLAADIRSAINEGALAVNYVGHGNIDTWGDWIGSEKLLSNASIQQLRNGPRQPIFTTATCMNGWFDNPLRPNSMAEVWLAHPGGGGPIAWSPSGLQPTAGQAALLEAFYAGLHNGQGLPVGALTAMASASTFARNPAWADEIRTFVLLGDPALVVAGLTVPPTPTPTVTPTPEPRPTEPGSPVSVLYLPATWRH